MNIYGIYLAYVYNTGRRAAPRVGCECDFSLRLHLNTVRQFRSTVSHKRKHSI